MVLSLESCSQKPRHTINTQLSSAGPSLPSLNRHLKETNQKELLEICWENALSNPT